MRVLRLRKLAVDHEQMVVLLQLIDRLGEFAARRTLEISEFLQCDRGVRRTEDVSGFSRFLAGGFWDFQRRIGRDFGAIQKGAAADGHRRDQDNDDKRSVSSHETGRKI